jgi:hypothetical protein
MKQKTIITILLVSAAGLIAGGLAGFVLGYTQGQASNINTYEECVAAGHPVQESYPEVCATPDGKRFTNPNANAAVTVEGKVICLQHKNPDQPHTLECAAGIETDSGKTYSLKADNELVGLAGSERRVQIQGTMEEKEDDIYQSAGQLTVNSFTTIE